MSQHVFDNRLISIIISLIWGFGLALLFRKICKNDECLIVKVPPLFNQSDNIINDHNRCYRLEKYTVTCTY